MNVAFLLIGLIILILVWGSVQDIRNLRMRRQGKLGCEYCGRYPVCGECGRCGDSACNSGCMFCVQLKGWRRFAIIPMKIPQSDRQIPFPGEEEK